MIRYSIIFILAIFLSSCLVVRETTWKTKKLVPVTKKIEADSTTITTTSWKVVTVEQSASSSSPMGIGYVPTLYEMSVYTTADANADVSRSMARAIDKDPNNIRILEKVPNPANKNDQRYIIRGDYNGYPYRYNNVGDHVYYGPPGRGRWMSTDVFEYYKERGETPPLF